MEKLKIKLGEAIFKDIEGLYSENSEDYDIFLDKLNILKNIIEEKNTTIDEICAIFKLKVITPAEVVQEDEDGNPLEETLEIPRSDEPLIKVTKKRGWVTSKIEDKIKGSYYFKLLKKHIGLPGPLFEEVTLNGLNILGRCNNPSDWGNDKQGLVMGMVQSGKTVSMLNLMSQGMSTGYNVFILLAGGKESLRIQSQDRIRGGFNLIYNGAFYDQQNNITIYSPTDAQGYGSIPGNYLSIFKPNDNQNPIIVITILKQIDNLKALNNDILNLKDFCKHEKIDFFSRYTTMILDDESDYASMNTSKQDIKGIHEQLVKLRENLSKSCYVGYTATPQGCLASNPTSTIGYPKDFIWLLETMKQPGDARSTLSYMGLNEFFIQYEEFLIKSLSKESWPHHQKKSNGVSEGIYDPVDKIMIKRGSANLNALEKKCANAIKDGIKEIPAEFIEAVMEFILGCGIRWFRHFNKLASQSFPTLAEAQANYPYHAMMFNLSLTQKNHTVTVKVIEDICFKKIEREFSKWENDKPSLFDNAWIRQVKKTSSLKTNNDINNNLLTIKKFCSLAIQLTKSPIIGGINGNFIYKLNAEDDSNVLNYNDNDIRRRTKKCAIFTGGNILSRGLTIENLSVSVFIRSQADSLGDTTLQMCRWFGHKKQDIDLLSLYIMEPLRSLFKDIAKCDGSLRLSIKSSIINDLNPDKVMIELWSSNLFKVTSSIKARSLKKQKGSAVSFSGKTAELRQPFCSGDTQVIKKNLDFFNDYISKISCEKKSKNHWKRGDLYSNVDFEQLHNFLSEIKISKDALYASPGTYADFIHDWYQGYLNGYLNNPLPKINIGVLYNLEKGKISSRQREFTQKPTNRIEAILYKKEMIGALLGGSQKKAREKYKGDRFFDKDANWHKENIDIEVGSRKLKEPILLLFYKINPNYLIRLGKGNPIKMIESDNEYIDSKEILTFGAVTPIGGPSYQVHTNTLINI